MNHKRKRPKNQRNGCLLCKPHKHQANKDSLTNQTLQEQKAIENFNSQLLNKQEDLGPEFRKVLNENLWDLYEK